MNSQQKPHIWSKYYSESPEIWSYLKGIERENNFIHKYVKLRHVVTHAQWTDREAIWKLKIKDLATGSVFEDRADIFLNGGGVLK
jgi:cation diffusion facilitator CzcD-associated flavoprotein CzcO